MRRVLVIDDRAKRKAEAVTRHAKRRANWYHPRASGWLNRIPGNDRRHVVMLNDYRCVFSWTVADGKVCRHLSISVPSEHFPAPEAVRMIAELFDFTVSAEILENGFPADWFLDIKRDGPIDDHCVVVGQETGINP